MDCVSASSHVNTLFFCSACVSYSFNLCLWFRDRYALNDVNWYLMENDLLWLTFETANCLQVLQGAQMYSSSFNLVMSSDKWSWQKGLQLIY